MIEIHVKMTRDTFAMIFLEHHIKNHEHFLKVIFHGSAAHLKDFVSERLAYVAHHLQYTFLEKIDLL